MASWDPRTPVWEGVVKGKIVRIYDMEKYLEAKRLYPDDPDFHTHKIDNVKPAFEKKKPAARYNWVSKDLAREMKEVAG